jgi:hypothetical protein
MHRACQFEEIVSSVGNYAMKRRINPQTIVDRDSALPSQVATVSTHP